MRVDRFIRIIGRIAGVGAAMAEMNEELSPGDLLEQTAQALLEEGLETPAAIVQDHLLEWEQEDFDGGDEREVEDAVTVAADDSSDHEEGEQPVADLFGDDESHHPSQNAAFATANTQLNELPNLGLGFVQNEGAVPANRSPGTANRDYADRLEEVLGQSRRQREEAAGFFHHEQPPRTAPPRRSPREEQPSAPYPPGYSPRPSAATNPVPETRAAPHTPPQASGSAPRAPPEPRRRSVHFGREQTRSAQPSPLRSTYPPYSADAPPRVPAGVHLNSESISGYRATAAHRAGQSASTNAPFAGATSTIGGYHIPITTAPSAPASMASRSMNATAPQAVNQWALPGADQANLRDSLGIGMLISIFNKCLGDDPTEPPPTYLKQIKLKAPDSFDGTDDNDAFNVWLENLLCYLDVLRLRGPNHDKERIAFTRSSLTGKAAVWYQQTVTSPIRPVGHGLTHFESIVGLYRRFILTDQFAAAAKGFAAVRFEPHNGGVSRLYDQLVYFAERMFQPPNEMTMKERFIEALPGRIERVLTVSRGLHQRRDPLAVFVKSACEIEEAIEGFQSRRGDGSQSRPSAPTGTRPSSASKGKRRAGPPRLSNSTVQPPRQELPARRDTRPPPRAGNAGQRGPARFKDSSSKPTTFRAGPSTSQSKPTVKCYKCGGMGHISTDPKCPQYGKDTRLHAQRIVEIDDSEEEEPVPEEPNPEAEPDDIIELEEEQLEELPLSDYEDDYPLDYESPDEIDWDGEPEGEEHYFAMHVEPTFTHLMRTSRMPRLASLTMRKRSYNRFN